MELDLHFKEGHKTLNLRKLNKTILFLLYVPKTNGKKNMERAITAYTRCGDGHMVKQTWKGLWLSQKSTIREIGIICACSDHGQPRCQIWIKCDKRQMTSCVHKMCGRTYGQTNMKRAITLAKINHPWNRCNMRMLISWPIKIPNMNKMRQKTND